MLGVLRYSPLRSIVAVWSPSSLSIKGLIHCLLFADVNIIRWTCGFAPLAVLERVIKLVLSKAYFTTISTANNGHIIHGSTQALVQYLEVMNLHWDLLVSLHRQIQVGMIEFWGAAWSQIVIQILVVPVLVKSPPWRRRKHVRSFSALRVLVGQSFVHLAALPLDFLLICLHERLGQVNWLIFKLSQVARLIGRRTHTGHHGWPHALASSAWILRCAPLGDTREQLAEHTTTLLLLMMLLEYLSYRVFVTLAILHRVEILLVLR